MPAILPPHTHNLTIHVRNTQTEKYEPPALLEGGRLPINEHGNMEVLGGNRAFLPRGTYGVLKLIEIGHQAMMNTQLAACSSITKHNCNRHCPSGGARPVAGGQAARHPVRARAHRLV